MTPTHQQEIVKVLQDLWEVYPAYRFGQMVRNVAFLARPSDADPTQNVDDAAFLKAARRHLADMKAQAAAVV